MADYVRELRKLTDTKNIILKRNGDKYVKLLW